MQVVVVVVVVVVVLLLLLLMMIRYKDAVSRESIERQYTQRVESHSASKTTNYNRCFRGAPAVAQNNWVHNNIFHKSFTQQNTVTTNLVLLFFRVN